MKLILKNHLVRHLVLPTESSSLKPTKFCIYYVRTPSITSQGKLLSYDGVLIDITRQAIAEHRLSNSVWREGLATLTNGLVHDFSNLMAGIFSISELLFWA